MVKPRIFKLKIVLTYTNYTMYKITWKFRDFTNSSKFELKDITYTHKL